MAKRGPNKSAPQAASRPKGLAIQIVWFEPKRKSSPRQPISTVADLQSALEPFRDHERLVVYLDKDGGQAGSVYVHRTADRAWVTHFETVGGVDSYCRDVAFADSDEQIEFQLSNAQFDEIHKYWTVPADQAQQALEYFVQHGKRDPGLNWVTEPASLEEPLQ